MPKLERSIKRFAGEFGETNAQAVIRWSVQTCRELAGETQVWGKKAKEAKKRQTDAIIGDAYNVLLVAKTVSKTKKGYRCTNSNGKFYASNRKFLSTAKQVNDWIEINRTRRRARTAKLPPSERKVCTAKRFNSAVKIRAKNAGMAKGGWLGAGMDIARAQKGQERINIGKNFLGYAQKHSRFGSSTKPQSGFKPAAFVTNNVSHVSSPHVLKRGAYDKALSFGLKATLKWYAKSIRALDKKKL